MDNLKVHKMKRVREIIEVVGAAEVLFLAPYCADFSPIEETFFQGEGHPAWGIGASTREALLERPPPKRSRR